MREIKIKYHTKFEDKSHILREVTPKDNAIDIVLAEDITLGFGEFILAKTTFSLGLPDGYKARVMPRSSTFKKWGVTIPNSPSLIDTAYRGNDDIWRIPLLRRGRTDEELIDFLSRIIDSKANDKETIKKELLKDNKNVITIPKGTAIAQFEILPIQEEWKFKEVDDLGSKNRSSTNNKLEEVENEEK